MTFHARSVYNQSLGVRNDLGLLILCKFLIFDLSIIVESLGEFLIHS